jgi:hypothetical protein
VSVYGDLVDALKTTPVLPRDLVTVALARRYAATIDDLFDELVGASRPCPRCRVVYDEGDAIEDGAEHARKILEIARIGQRLEGLLDRLGMAPSARPAVPQSGGEAGGDPTSGELDRLRSDAAAGAPTTGIDYAAAVDPAVTDADTED